jgi:hypothetical protein
MDFLQSWTGMIIMVLVLGGLVGLLFFLRNKRSDD